MDSMKTASYPSGHSAQGTLIASVLKDKYRQELNLLLCKTAKNISDSRNMAHAHYISQIVKMELN